MEHISRHFKISMSVMHPSMDPQAVTAKLRLKPNREHRAGDERLRLDGKPLGGKYPTAFWLHKFDVSDLRDLVPSIEKILSDLERHADFFRYISESGGATELFCGIFITTNWDECIPHQLLGRLSAIGIDLRLDAYPQAKPDKGTQEVSAK